MKSLVNLNANMVGIFLGIDLYKMKMEGRHHRSLFNIGTNCYMNNKVSHTVSGGSIVY